MPTIPYKIDGQLVPGVTTILAQLGWNKNALIAWAYKRGKEGLPLYDDKAIDVGTLTHSCIEAHLNETELPEVPAEYSKQVEQAVENFLSMWQRNRMEIELVEPHWVSPKHQFGGTPDLICRRGKSHVVVDWKTTKSGIYPEHKIQVEAYMLLAQENGFKATEGWLVRLGKDSAEWDVHVIKSSNARRKVFLNLLQIYKLKGEVG